MRVLLLRAMLILLACPAMTMPVVNASAMADDSAMFAAAASVADDELAQQRGGFVIDGLDIRLGAQIRTVIDGQLSLMTTISWTDEGVSTSRTVSGLLSPASAAELQAGLLDTGHVSMNVGNAEIFLANGGRTAVIQNLNGGIQSVLVNTASNTSIQTQIDATIDLSGYAAFLDTVRAGNIAASLGQAIGAATLGAVTR